MLTLPNSELPLAQSASADRRLYVRGVRRAGARIMLVLVALSFVVSCGGRPESGAAGVRSAPGDASYSGGEACAGCHERQTALWKDSHHARSMQPVDDMTVLGDFSGVGFTSHGLTSHFRVENESYLVWTDSPDGRLHEYEIAYTFGIVPLQQYLVRFPRGRYQALSVAWDARPASDGGQRWFHLNPAERIDYRDSLHWTGPAQNWNYMCAECHSTNLRKNYSPAADRYETAWSEINVSCEACHGPGSRHVAWARAGADRSGAHQLKGLTVSLKDADQWVIPAHGRIATRMTPLASRTEVDTCGRCHSRRTQIWADYMHGPLGDTHRVELLEEGLYELDGQQLDEVYEYGSFLQSRMYAAGVTCSDCHDPHSGRLRRAGNAVCTQCHAAAIYDARTHSVHPAGTEASQCVSCHMPRRYYMVVDGRRDHRFHVPRPDESVRFGTANACTACHPQQGPAWASRAVARWYGSAAADRPSFTEALGAGRLWRPEAGEMLAQLVDARRFPGIVRATAVTLLARHPGRRSTDAISHAAVDTDSLVRRAAASALASLEPVTRARVGASLLGDRVRSVRVEAVLAMAGVPAQLLSVEARQAFASAVAEYRQVQRFNADRPEAHVNLGALEMQLGRPRQADAAFRASIELQPQFAPAYLALADLQRASGHEGEAERTLRQGLGIVPEAADLHHAVGLALVRQKRMRDALPSLERAMQLGRGDPRYAYVYGVALHDAGDREGALRVLEQASNSFAADRDILQALVSYSLEAGNLPTAREWAERLVEIAPDDPRARGQLEQLRDSTGR